MVGTQENTFLIAACGWGEEAEEDGGRGGDGDDPISLTHSLARSPLNKLRPPRCVYAHVLAEGRKEGEKEEGRGEIATFLFLYLSLSCVVFLARSRPP